MEEGTELELAVVGADGFSFVTPDKSRVEEARASLGKDAGAVNASWTRIHSLGAVEIGDDVELGANSCIDRGTIRSTRIGNGTKLDNLVHVGHNCEVGNDVPVLERQLKRVQAPVADRVNRPTRQTAPTGLLGLDQDRAPGRPGRSGGGQRQYHGGR